MKISRWRDEAAQMTDTWPSQQDVCVAGAARWDGHQIFLLFRENILKNIFSLGYDTEYTETDRKDIQNLAQEIETKYNNYGEGIANKFANWELSPTVQSCGRRWSTRQTTRCRAAAWRCAWTGAWTSCSAGPRPVKTTSTCHTMLTRRRTPAGIGDTNQGREISRWIQPCLSMFAS